MNVSNHVPEGRWTAPDPARPAPARLAPADEDEHLADDLAGGPAPGSAALLVVLERQGLRLHRAVTVLFERYALGQISRAELLDRVHEAHSRYAHGRRETIRAAAEATADDNPEV